MWRFEAAMSASGETQCPSFFISISMTDLLIQTTHLVHAGSQCSPYRY